VVEEGRDLGISVRHVGIGMPELVGLDGQIETHLALPWRTRDVTTKFRKYGKVTIASDVMAASLAEARLGAGRGQPAFLYVTVGTGISCTLVIEGIPYAGAHGHAISFASGPSAAARGADGGISFVPLESRASGPGIFRRARELGLQESDAIAVAKSAYAKAGVARSLIDEAATELAIHVAIVANTLDPTLVVLGGGLGSAPGRYWSTFRSELPKHLFGPLARRLRVRRAELGAAAGTIGAALCAIDAA
jgi:glucokinase